MGKYEPLASHLQRREDDSWIASFAEIEAVLGSALPPSAHKHPAWWANQSDGGHSQSRGWQDAGWQVWKVDFDRKQVEFRRPQPRSGKSREPGPDNRLFEQASAYLGTDDREQLIREALKALCEREAARRLARLVGTMPDLEAPPRRRMR
jgi:hypothetical protein